MEKMDANHTSREFEGRVALVTGGSRGIGRACCQRLAQAGAGVAINYLRNEKEAEETAKRVEQHGVAACLARADIRHADQVDTMVQEVTQQLGPVDLLVNKTNRSIREHKESTSVVLTVKTSHSVHRIPAIVSR